jgi:methanogenic corrinoid protein MtbC1
VRAGQTMGHPQEHDAHGLRDAKIAELAGAYTAALLSGDEVMAEMAIREAMDVNLSTADIDEKLIAPALWLVGELWERGQISVADEHIATEISLRVLALQREAQRVARSRVDYRVMCATPEGERHVVALRMVANLLLGAGYEIVMLGAEVPAADLGATARRYEAQVICLSQTMAAPTDRVLSAIDDVLEEGPSAGFVVGGRGLIVEGQLRPRVHVCDRVSDVVDAVDALVQRADLN